MQLIANKSNLKKYGKELLGNNYSEDNMDYSKDRLKQLVNVCLNGFERTYGHISHDRAAHLNKIDKILGNFGVEGFLDPVDIQYSNTGETYSITIFYYLNKLWIGDWGSVVWLTSARILTSRSITGQNICIRMPRNCTREQSAEQQKR